MLAPVKPPKLNISGPSPSGGGKPHVLVAVTVAHPANVKLSSLAMQFAWVVPHV